MRWEAPGCAERGGPRPGGAGPVEPGLGRRSARGWLLRHRLRRTAEAASAVPAESGDRVVGAGRVAFRGTGTARTLDGMHMRRRASYRASHHPHVHCEGGGRWRWACACGAGGWSLAGGWQVAYTAALVHQSMSPGE